MPFGLFFVLYPSDTFFELKLQTGFFFFPIYESLFFSFFLVSEQKLQFTLKIFGIPAYYLSASQQKHKWSSCHRDSIDNEVNKPNRTRSHLWFTFLNTCRIYLNSSDECAMLCKNISMTKTQEHFCIHLHWRHGSWTVWTLGGSGICWNHTV